MAPRLSFPSSYRSSLFYAYCVRTSSSMIPIIRHRRAFAPCLVLRQAHHVPPATRRLSTSSRPSPLVATTTRVNLGPLPQTSQSSRASISSSPKGHAAETDLRQRTESLDPSSFEYRLQRKRQPDPYLSSDPVLGTNVQDLPPASTLWKPWTSHIHAQWPDGRMKEPTEVISSMMRAVQVHDSAEAVALIRLLVYLSRFQDVLPALKELPRTSVSSLFRLVDPEVAGERIDYAHNLRVDSRLQDLSSLSLSMDEFGIRQNYKDLLDNMEAFATLVVAAHGSLVPAEFEVLLRCAGATSDVDAVRRIWYLMQTPGDEGGTAHRTARNYEAFIRSRYLTEDLYTQNDLARTVYRARSMRGIGVLSRRSKRRLDRHRIHLAFANLSKYGFSPSQPTKHLSWTTSGRLPLKRITRIIFKRGIIPDEKLLSAIMRAKGRSGQAKQVFRTLKRQYGFVITRNEDHRDPDLSFKLGDDSQYAATASAGYLDSVVTTLGTLGYPIVARRFLDFIQTEYNIQVPRSAWSNVLKYTFLAQTVRREWEIVTEGRRVRNQVIYPADVLVVWNRMTELRLMDKPLFEERDVYVKSLIITREFDKALVEMRKGFEEYREATKKVQHALTAVLYPAPPASVNTEFLRAKSVQHAMWDSIARWCEMFLWRYTRHERTASATTVDVPLLVAEFSEFTDGIVNYRTLSGMVRLIDQSARIRQHWGKREKFESAPIEALVADDSKPAVHSDGQPITYNSVTNQPMYYSQKMVLARQMEGRRLQRSKRVWEKYGLEVCLSRRDKGGPALNKRQTVQAIEW